MSDRLTSFGVNKMQTGSSLSTVAYMFSGGGAENAGVENAEIHTVWKAVRIKYSQVSANGGGVGLASLFQVQGCQWKL